MELNELSSAIIGAGIEVHKKLGPGMLESPYHTCLEYELVESGFHVVSQVPMPLVYKGVRMEVGYRIDMIVNHLIVVEIKSVENILEVHKAQILTYLRLSGLELGLLINFNVPRLTDGIKRFIKTQ